MLVKITRENYKNGEKFGDRIDSKLIENTRQAKEEFIIDEYGKVPDYGWYSKDGTIEDFLNGKITNIEREICGDWDEPDSEYYYITTYEEEKQKLEKELEKIQNTLVNLKKDYKVE